MTEASLEQIRAAGILALRGTLLQWYIVARTHYEVSWRNRLANSRWQQPGIDLHRESRRNGEKLDALLAELNALEGVTDDR